MPAHEDSLQLTSGQPHDGSPDYLPVVATGRHPMRYAAVVPVDNQRQALHDAYGFRPPPPPEVIYEQVEAIARAFGQAATSPPRPAPPRSDIPPASIYKPAAPAHRPTPGPWPPAVAAPKPPAAKKPPADKPAAKLPPADNLAAGNPEPPPAAPNRRSARWIALIAATSLAGVTGAAVWAVDARAKTQTCDTVQALSSAGTGGPTSTDLTKAEQALHTPTRRLLFHGGLKDSARGLTADIAALRRIDDVTQMLAVVASINDHGRAAQRECGMPEKNLFEVTSG
jgi:hypothetical protein